MWMKRLAVKVIVERKEESVRAHSMPTGVTFVRHSARSLAKTHVCRQGLVMAEASSRTVEWRDTD